MTDLSSNLDLTRVRQYIDYNRESGRNNTANVLLECAFEIERLREELATAERLLTIMTSAAGKHAERVVELESAHETSASHPEDFCERCHRPNIVWFAPSPIWNKAAGNHSILCPVCFVRLAEAAGIRPTAWQVAPEAHGETAARQPTDIAYALDVLERYRDMTDPECTCEPCPECLKRPVDCSGTPCASTCQCSECDHCRVLQAIEGLRPAMKTFGEITADAVVSRLYRRFKEWNRRGFGPGDVTWCEVKTDVLALIKASETSVLSIEAVRNARLEWAMVCGCPCKACDALYIELQRLCGDLPEEAPATHDTFKDLPCENCGRPLDEHLGVQCPVKTTALCPQCEGTGRRFGTDQPCRICPMGSLPKTTPPQCNCPRDDMGAHAIWCDVNAGNGKGDV